VSELPWLYDLVCWSDPGPDDTHRIFYGYARNRSIHQLPDKIESFLLFFSLLSKPSRTGCTQMSAWRVSNHQFPPIIEHLQHVPLYVVPGRLSW
jgi:hypothetical protein